MTLRGPNELISKIKNDIDEKIKQFRAKLKVRHKEELNNPDLPPLENSKEDPVFMDKVMIKPVATSAKRNIGTLQAHKTHLVFSPKTGERTFIR